MSSGSGPSAPMDVDLKQQLIYVLMCIKEMGANVNGLERKIDGTAHSMSSIEQQLLQMRQQQIFAKMDKPLGLVDVDALFKKNFQQSQQQSSAVSDQQCSSLKRLEQGVNDLYTHMNNHVPTQEMRMLPAHQSAQENKYAGGFQSMSQLGASISTEGKAGAVDHSLSSVREELSSFQASLMEEMKSQQTALGLFKTQCLERQEALMIEFQQFSAVKSRAQPPPQQLQQPSGPNGQAGMANINYDISDTPRLAASPRIDPSLLPDMRYIVPVSQGNNSIMEVPVDLKPLVSPEPIEPEKEEPAQEEEEEVHHSTIILQESSSLAAVFSNDDDVSAPPYHVEEAYWKTGICQTIARSDRFANFTVLVVIFNAVYIGFDSDYNTAQNIYKAPVVFQACSQFFCVYFTWELVVRFLAFEIKHSCLKDGWFKFDAFLVSTMILDTWVLMPILFLLGGGVQIPTQPLRMLRLFKLTRMARLMKALPELVTQIKGLCRSLRAISSSMILVGLMVYVWAIMMHMLMKEEVDYNEELWQQSSLSFATMTSCIWSLLMAGTMMLDDSSPLMSSLLFSKKFNYVLAGFLFVMYAMMSAMCILQMLIGVLCDVVSTVKAEEQSATAIGLLKQELLVSLASCDDGDGKISEAELKVVMHHPKSKALFRRLKINHAFLIELQRGLYRKPGMQVPILDILELMVQCRGENNATVETMSGALVRIINELTTVRGVLETDLGKLENRLARDIRELREATSREDRDIRELQDSRGASRDPRQHGVVYGAV